MREIEAVKIIEQAVIFHPIASPRSTETNSQ
jgi:hypothetical protein